MTKLTIALWFAGGALSGLLPCMAWSKMTTVPMHKVSSDPPPYCPPFCSTSPAK